MPPRRSAPPSQPKGAFPGAGELPLPERLVLGEILSPGLDAGARLAPMRSLAAKYGVTYLTLSRAVAKLSKAGVVKTEGRHGMFVRSLSRAVRHCGRRPVVALVTLTGDYHIRPLVAALAGALHGEGLQTVEHLIRHGGVDQTGALRDFVERWRPCALVARLPNDYPHLAYFSELYERQRLPVVFIENEAPFPAPRVHVGDREGGRLAARHLLELGHRSLAWFGGIFDLHDPLDPASQIPEAARRASRERYSGFRDGLADWGIAEAPASVGLSIFHPASQARGVERILDLVDGGVTAFGCSSDLGAAWFRELLLHHGIEVPARVSVVGFDAESEAAPGVRLTSVDPRTDEIVRQVVAWVRDELHRPQSARGESRVITPALFVGETTVAPPSVIRHRNERH